MRGVVPSRHRAATAPYLSAPISHPDRQANQRWYVPHAELAHQTAAIGVHRLGRKMKQRADFRAGMTLDHQQCDLALAR